MFARIVAALAAIPLAGPMALAGDIPGNTSTAAVITPGPAEFEGVFEKQRDSDWYRVTLKGDHNYAFEASSYCDTRLDLRDAAGKVLRSSGLASDNGDAGFEFRPATTATLFLKYLDANPAVCLEFGGGYPHPYYGDVATEVRGDPTTRATIAPGQKIGSLVNWSDDKDHFRARLDAGKRYTITLNDGQPVGPPLFTRAYVVDPKGNVVAQGPGNVPPPKFKVAASGTYYVVVAGGGESIGPYPYTVGLTTP